MTSQEQEIGAVLIAKLKNPGGSIITKPGDMLNYIKFYMASNIFLGLVFVFWKYVFTKWIHLERF